MQIADLKFDVADCRLEAYCYAENMQWNVEIGCNANADGKLSGFAPGLSLSLFETPPAAFSHWLELAPQEVRWVEKRGTDDTPSGLLDVFEHTPIYHCTAHCYNKSGQMHIKIDARCDVLFDAPYSTNLELHLDAPVVFRGVWFGRRKETECRTIISKFLNPDDFDFTPTEHGISILTPKPRA